MTCRNIWEYMLTELSKVNAPSMLLQDFNYFLNKAVNQYINKRYNIYDVNQQTTDDLRVLKATTVLDVTKSADVVEVYKQYSGLGAGMSRLFGGTYEVTMPEDYMHLLNCVCIFKLNSTWKCYDGGDYVQFAAKRLTADSWSTVVNDYYNRPQPWRPYFYIHNVNQSNDIPTNPIANIDSDDGTQDDGTDMNGEKYKVTIDTEGNIDETRSNFRRRIKLTNADGVTVDAVDRETAYRYGNASNVRMEIRYGEDDTVFALQNVVVDYIKTPQFLRLTQEQVNLTKDTSQIMEFPDYVCQEIVNELTLLVMENTADPRLQSNNTVTQTIATPTQQSAAPQTQQRQ